MSQSSIDIELPVELATLLLENNHAQQATGRRSGVWQVLATFATGAATTVSLLQTPQTIAYFAEKCRELASRKRKDGAAREYIEAKGPHGQLRIPITPETSVDDIERLLRSTIFAKETET